MPPPPRTLSILVPVFNEREHAEPCLRRLLEAEPLISALGLTREVILVDDCSTDGTTDILARWCEEHPGHRLLRHPVNLGKGAAIRTAMAAATGDILLVHDADLEYDPRDHPAVLRPVLEGRADAVIGSRFIGHTHRVLYFWHMVVNKGLTLLSNVTTNLNLTDIECCTKALTRQAATRITLEENRFGFEPEIIAKLARLRLDDPPRRARIYEVAVSYDGRTYAEGKKIRAKDGVRALWVILRHAVGS